MFQGRQRLVIKNLGPIEYCDILLSKMTVLCGAQAQGKSTIAKAIFFFRSVKTFLSEALISPKSDPVVKLEFKYVLLEKFQQIFGRLKEMSEDMSVSFEYASNLRIEISNIYNGSHPVRFSGNVDEWINKYVDISLDFKNLQRIKKEAEIFFKDDHEIIYIPAGRSMLSNLSDALSYIFFKLNDRQKEMIDYCTTSYIEFITSIKGIFDPESRRFPEKLFYNSQQFEQLKIIDERAKHILKGRYIFSEGNEYLSFDCKENEKTIGIRFASSGQQEVLWILNSIYYCVSSDKAAFFIIEEPEAHLYPNTQKEVAEYIVASLTDKNECLITTHSPYILGSLNNILDARRLLDKGVDVSNIIKNEKIPLLTRQEDLCAYFVNGGRVYNALDNRIGLIKNELIDDASDDINRVTDKLIEAEQEQQ